VHPFPEAIMQSVARVSTCLLLLAATIAHRAQAQVKDAMIPDTGAEQGIVPRGPRVRLRYATAVGTTTATGYLDRADSATVVLRGTPMRGHFEVPRSAIRSSELSIGARQHKAAGFVLGLVGGGLLAGGIAGLAHASPHGGNADADIRAMAVVGSGVLGALAGSVIGAIVGRHVTTERWTPYQLPARRDPP
jgi:hypothetical protein